MIRIPPWAWMLLFLALVGLLAVSCAPKVPPSLFADAPPPLPEVAAIAGDRHDDDCATTPIDKGEPIPVAVVERAGNGTTARASCSGLVVPEGLVAEWYAYPTAIEAWRASAEHQRASCVRDRGYAEGAYGAEWTAHGACRADLRASKWAAVGTGIGGVVLGAALGWAIGSLP